MSLLHTDLVSSLNLSDRILNWNYVNKLIAAPMVRISTLPFRLLCVNHGADIVYSEELIAVKLAKCTRSYNASNDTIEYVLPDSNNNPASCTPVLATYQHEPLVVQLGVSNGVDALAAASVVLNDCCAIDINGGCPKRFSTQGAMGSALLSNVNGIDDIVRTLKRNINKPVTMKIRLLDSNKQTIELIKQIQSMGVTAIAVHCRMIDDRPLHRAATHRFNEIYDICNTVDTPILYNGDAFDYGDIDTIKQQTGCNTLLLARGSLWNPSIFHYSSTGLQPLPLYDISSEYLDIAQQYSNILPNTKYCLSEMYKLHISKHTQFERLTQSKSYSDLHQAIQSISEINVCRSVYKKPVLHWRIKNDVIEQPNKKHKHQP